jgi:hypothetical protein
MGINLLDWTHKNVQILDIRKINKLYVLKIKDVDESLFVHDEIFEQRIKSFFLKDTMSQIPREDILKQNWNFYITKGYYIKVDQYGHPTKYDQDYNKSYISYLDIAGPLSTFSSVYQKEKPISTQLNS